MRTLMVCFTIIASFLASLSTAVAFAAGFVFRQSTGAEILFPIVTIITGLVLFFCVRWGFQNKSLAVGVVLIILGLFSIYGGINSLIKLSTSYADHSEVYLISIAQERFAALGEQPKIVDGKIMAPTTLIEDYRAMMIVDLGISLVMACSVLPAGITLVRRFSQAAKTGSPAGSPSRD